MISFQSPLPEFENSSKKRRFEDDHDQKTSEKRSKADQSLKSMFDMELHLETPLPLEWQRCLDIQSGQIHFYNTRTHTRTSKDPRRSPEPEPEPETSNPAHMSLDLELNLPCDSSVKKVNATDHDQLFNKHSPKINSSGGVTRNLSWLPVEEEEEQEMVATVCMRCHMLVILCKSSPACPNCKFMHPPDQGPPKLFKQRPLSLLC